VIKTSSRCRFTLTLLVLAIVVVTVPAQAQTFSVLHDFLGNNSGDGCNPSYSGIVAQGRDGNMYGTTYVGGTSNLGTVFKITPARENLL
jgi:uncharacterized repeat protein (TIGR03803 family)